MTRNACRHFTRDGIRPTCTAGRDIKAWVKRCGNPQGWLRQIPCTGNAPDKPLFDCPELDRKTNEEVAARRKELSEHMDEIVKGLPALARIKRRMIAEGQSGATETCPWCEEKALNVTIALNYNNHADMTCSACGMGVRE